MPILDFHDPQTAHFLLYLIKGLIIMSKNSQPLDKENPPIDSAIQPNKEVAQIDSDRTIQISQLDLECYAVLELENPININGTQFDNLIFKKPTGRHLFKMADAPDDKKGSMLRELSVSLSQDYLTPKILDDMAIKPIQEIVNFVGTLFSG